MQYFYSTNIIDKITNGVGYKINLFSMLNTNNGLLSKIYKQFSQINTIKWELNIKMARG